MADKTIGDLNTVPGTIDDSNTLFVVQQSGAAYKVAGSDFISALTVILDGHGGIKTIAKTGSAGTPVVDTYTITYADNTTSTFTVTNGAKGNTGAASYVHIKYSSVPPTSDADMTDDPSAYMGVYSGTSSSAPAHYTSYTWNLVKGTTGSPATLSSSQIVYQEGTSPTVAPTGSWVSVPPVVAQGNYLWARTTLNFNSGSPVVWYDVSYQAIDGQGAPSSATPLMDGTASAGSGTSFSRDDHIHPTDTSRQASITASGVLKGLGSGSVSAAAKGTDYGALSFTVTLTTTWTGNAQTVSNANFATSGYAYIVSPASSSFLDYGAAQIYADNVTTSGQMTFHCVDAPSSSLTVNITRVVSA